MTCDFDAWMDENYERLRDAWASHISEMEDATAHKVMLASSDKAFEEFAYEAYSDCVAEVKHEASQGEQEPDGAA